MAYIYNYIYIHTLIYIYIIIYIYIYSSISHIERAWSDGCWPGAFLSSKPVEQINLWSQKCMKWTIFLIQNPYISIGLLAWTSQQVLGPFDDQRGRPQITWFLPLQNQQRPPVRVETILLPKILGSSRTRHLGFYLSPHFGYVDILHVLKVSRFRTFGA